MSISNKSNSFLLIVAFIFIYFIMCWNFSTLDTLLFEYSLIMKEITSIPFFFYLLKEDISILPIRENPLFHHWKYAMLLSLIYSSLNTYIFYILFENTEKGFIFFVEIFFELLALHILLIPQEKRFIKFLSVLHPKNNLNERLDKFIQQLPTIMRTEDLNKIISEEILQILNPSYLVLLKYTARTENYSLYSNTGCYSEDFVLTDNMKNEMKTKTRYELYEADGNIGIFLYNKQETSYVVWVGHTLERAAFCKKQKQWILTFGKYIHLVYENLNCIHQVIKSFEEQNIEEQIHSVTLRRLIFQLSEKERRRLASDLHDEALQDQILWYRKLETLLNESILEEDLKGQLEKIKGGMLDVIHQIRNTCNELRPSLLSDIGLIGSVKEWLSQAQLRTESTIHFEYYDIQEKYYNFEQILSLYRVIQELINNAKKHSQSTNVLLSISEIDSMILLKYSDNGIGFDLDSSRSLHKHMGLSGIKERIHSLGGEITIVTSVGKGTVVQISIPR
ncbi:sensor histidine kinase [Paenibacillus polymyxa]|uniref:sensor histidine kinase n=1 Tax=Paenibacillus polymyxa TaxID=1406 RepID=UPI0008FC80FA|nr:sensor histidine kinase [Paenibacillus polymyxa]APB70023.1 sensor histidine kinase [Paenibacillus polymyxa]